jgi:signal transduction histidine kinase
MMKKGIHIIITLVLLHAGVGITSLHAQDATRRIDSLERVLVASPPKGEDLARAYHELMHFYVETTPEKSMTYARQCLEMAVALNKPDMEASCNNVLGRNFYKLLQYDSARVYYEKSLELYKQMRDEPKTYTEQFVDTKLAQTYGNIGNLYNMQGKNHLALEYYQKVLPIFEKYGQTANLALACLNIGELYRSIDNTRQAEINLRKMDSLAHISSDSLFIAYAKYSLGALYCYTKRYPEALTNTQAAHAYFSLRPEEDEWTANICCLFADIYLKGYADTQKAEEYAQQATLLYEKLGLPNMALNNFSQIYLKRGQWNKAAQAALAALAADSTDPHNNLLQYTVLAKAYAHLGNAAQTEAYLDKLTELQVSWSNKNYQTSLSEMETIYETEKKETQIATLEGEKRLMIWLGVAGGAVLLLALAALFFLWRWTVQKRRLAENRNALAEQQIRQLEQEKQLIATQSVLDGEVQERIRLARDLHDGLGSMLAGLKMKLVRLKNDVGDGNTCTASFDSALATLDDSMNEMRRVAHHLMPDALSRFGLKSAISDFCDTFPAANFVWYGSEQRLDPKLETVAYRIIHELIHNAVKHSGASQILVQIVQEPDRIALTVQDNGCGFNPSAVTAGMGLTNIRTRVASFGGNLFVDAAPGAGTEITVELPVNGEL